MRSKRPLSLRLILIWLLLGTALSARPTGAQQAAEYVPGEILVGIRRPIVFDGTPLFQPFAHANAATIARPVGNIAGEQPSLNAYRVRLRPGVSIEAAVAYMRRQGGVLYAEPNYIMHVTATPNNAQFGLQYALTKTQTDKAWELWNPHATTIIAIIDTGVDVTHPALANKIVAGQNLSGDGNAATDVTNLNSHGTHCAGIAAAQINNLTDTAGVAGWTGLPGATDATYTKIMPVKVFSGGSGTTSAVIDGINWAVANKARVLSLSLGGSTYSEALNSAVQNAWAAGCLIVAAAGNNGNTGNAPNYPAYLINVLSVANTDSTDTLNPTSVYGNYVRTAAPGTNIYSTLPSGQYGYKTGTSMACPFVAGEAALLWSQSPGLTNSNIAYLITQNVDPYTPAAPGQNIAVGAGRVNVLRALASLSPKLFTVGCAPRSVRGGGTVTGSVTLDGPAPPFGAVVTLSSSNACATVPASVTVSAGQTTVTFTVTTSAVGAARIVAITGTYAGLGKSVGLKVTP